MPVYHGNAANLALVSINIVKIFLRCRKFLFLSFFCNPVLLNPGQLHRIHSGPPVGDVE